MYRATIRGIPVECDNVDELAELLRHFGEPDDGVKAPLTPLPKPPNKGTSNTTSETTSGTVPFFTTS